MTYLPIDQMLKDAEALARQPSDGSAPIRDALTRDVVCHVKALACEVRELEQQLVNEQWSHSRTSTLAGERLAAAQNRLAAAEMAGDALEAQLQRVCERINRWHLATESLATHRVCRCPACKRLRKESEAGDE